MAVSSVIKSHFQVLMEHFDDPDQLQGVISGSEEYAALLQYPAATPLSEYCPNHPRRKLDVYCGQCGTELCSDCVSHGHSTHQCTRIVTVTGEETQRLGKAADHIISLLEETKRAVSVVKEMRQRVRSRKECNVDRTMEVFNSFRKLIDEREEQVIADIKKGADKREKALKVLHLFVVYTVASCSKAKSSDVSLATPTCFAFSATIQCCSLVIVYHLYIHSYSWRGYCYYGHNYKIV